MPSEFEQIVLDGLALNDGTNFEIVDGTFAFTPAKKVPQWVDNPDADGAALAYEPNYTNAEFAFSIRVAPHAAMDGALAAFGAIQAKLQKASTLRDKGGIPLVWTPANSSRTYTWYALLGELIDLPVAIAGDQAGWFLNAPLVPVKITCRPFGYTPERPILGPVADATPLQQVELKEVGGDVPAEGRMVLTDKATKDRRHLEWGLDQNSGACLITAASLSVTGSTGAVKTRSGAYASEKVIKGTALTTPTPLCNTGNLSLLGSYRMKARVYVTSTVVRYQLAYRTGDGPLKTLSAVAPPVINGFAEIDLGEFTFEEVVAGTQRGIAWIEAFTTEGSSEPEINYIELIPTGAGWGKGRGTSSTAAAQLLAFDLCEGKTGNIEGQALNLGGSWSETGKTGANGFVFNSSERRMQRTTVSDADPNSGCFALAGASSYSTMQIQATFKSSLLLEGKIRLGVLARYVNVENWLIAALTYESADSGVFPFLRIFKRVAGTVSSIGASGRIVAPSPALSSGVTVRLTAAADGTFQGWAFTPGSALGNSIYGQDVDLATGGTLVSGRAGIYDAWTSATACTRSASSFVLNAGIEAGRVLYSGRKAELRADVDDPLQRQDASGTYYGPPPSYRGARLLIPTAGDSGRIGRLVVKTRPNDVDLEADSSVTNNQEVEVKVAERFLAPR